MAPGLVLRPFAYLRLRSRVRNQWISAKLADRAMTARGPGAPWAGPPPARGSASPNQVHPEPQQHLGVRYRPPHLFLGYGQVGRDEWAGGPMPDGQRSARAGRFAGGQDGRAGGRIGPWTRRLTVARASGGCHPPFARAHAFRRHADAVVRHPLRPETRSGAAGPEADPRLRTTGRPVRRQPPRRPEPALRPGISSPDADTGGSWAVCAGRPGGIGSPWSAPQRRHQRHPRNTDPATRGRRELSQCAFRARPPQGRTRRARPLPGGPDGAVGRPPAPRHRRPGAPPEHGRTPGRR